jgi:uncharacterized membrane protein (UPF0127 family)
LRGLIGRRELEPGAGIVLRPSWSVHTFFLAYPIDVLFVDADQVVRKVVSNLRPWGWATCRDARDVVELRAGECAGAGVTVGQRVAWAAQPGRPPEIAADAMDARDSTHAAGNGKMRVLLGTSDDRFLRLARFLLTRGRFEVEATKRVVKTIDLVERHEPDVVVIDATESLGDAARTVAALEALHPHVAVIVVCDGEPPRWTTGLKVSEKWEALETLTDDVQALAEEARARN